MRCALTFDGVPVGFGDLVGAPRRLTTAEGRVTAVHVAHAMPRCRRCSGRRASRY